MKPPKPQPQSTDALSCRALDENDRGLFCRNTVFKGGFCARHQPKCDCKPNQSCTKDGKSNEEAEALIRKFFDNSEESIKFCELMRMFPEPEEAAYTTRNLKYPDPSEVEGKEEREAYLPAILLIALVFLIGIWAGLLWK